MSQVTGRVVLHLVAAEDRIHGDRCKAPSATDASVFQAVVAALVIARRTGPVLYNRRLRIAAIAKAIAATLVIA
jgi:hypothetical protein